MSAIGGDLAVRQFHDNRRSLAHLACYFQISAVQFDQGLCQRQSQTGAFVVAGKDIPDLSERLENFGEVIFLNADPGIVDLQTHPILSVRLDRNGCHASIRRKFDRVAEQIQENLLQPHLIGVNRRDVIRNRVGHFDPGLLTAFAFVYRSIRLRDVPTPPYCRT